MYSNDGYSSSFQITNNPFVNDPTNANARFPDISASGTFQGAQTGFPALGVQPGTMYQTQAYTFDGGGYGYTVPAPAGYPQSAPTVPQPQLQTRPSTYTQPFQPTSAFGQQLVSQVNGSGYGYLQGPGPTVESLSMAQQQIRNNPGYVAQFDPYASIGQGWDGQIQPQSQGQSQLASPTRSSFSSPSLTATSTSTSSSSSSSHPRDYIRTHKSELESWDTYAWKQLFNTFDALKDAWAARKQELQGRSTQMQTQYGGYYVAQVQQELGRLQTVSMMPWTSGCGMKG
jgi:hypothetical protein